MPGNDDKKEGNSGKDYPHQFTGPGGKYQWNPFLKKTLAYVRVESLSG
jgi:hypothetical protein